MKKLFDSKFLIISALSIVTLILLIVFSFFLFNRDEAEFLKSGYIINPLSSVSEKYFFDSGTGYRENLSSMVVFNDIDDKEVKVLRDSFIHYEDGDLALLKNGAILDVDSIHDNMALFYNISPDSVVERDGSSYFIESLSGKITLKDFIVRISDNKYLVAGNVKLGYTGSPSLIDGEYFEIVYSEEGIVNIENKEFKYELPAEGTKLYIGDYVIDLGTKVLSYRDNDIMSITAITIDGNENVEIIPKKEEPKTSSGEQSQNPSTSNQQSSSSEPGRSSSLNPSGESGSSSGSGNSSGSQGGQGGGGDTLINKNTPRVSLKDASVGPTNIDVVFDIENKDENDNYMLQVVNADTGNTIDITAEVLEDVPISVNLLTPSTKYLLTVVNRETKEQYFQKMFKTDTFGINLEKSYAKEDSITYKLTIGSDTKVNDANLTLYKFDEDSGENVETGKVIKLSDISVSENQEDYYLTFDGLESDSIYTAVLDNFALQSVNFRDVYSKSVTSLTLKKMPVFPNENSDLMSITEGERANDFKLYMGKIDDPNSAITKYTYYVYNTKNTPDTSDDELAMDPIVKDNASPITVKLGRLDNELQSDVRYYYKVIIEYFDNEKYMEYETIESSAFGKSEMPTITVVPLADEDNGEDYISYNTYNQIGAKIFINDKGCNIKLPDRPGVDCSADNVVKVIITKTDRTTGGQITVYEQLINFNYDGDNVVSPDIVVGNLDMGTTYYINAYTIYADSEDGALERIPHATDSSKTITTKTLANLSMEWKKPSVSSKVIEVNTKITGNSTDETMSVEDSISKITKMTFKIFNGDVRDKIDISEPLDVGNVYGNIYERFGEDFELITNEDVFNLTIDYLKEHNNGKVNSQYTIVAYAYYGEEGTKPIALSNSAFLYNVPVNYTIDDLTEPEISVEPIRNNDVNNYFDNISSNTIVGYSIDARIVDDVRLPIQSVVYRVYDRTGNPVKFYVKKANGQIDMDNPLLEYEIEYDGSISMVHEVYMDYGIDYNDSDDIMRRGNKYYVGFYLKARNIDTNSIENYPSSDTSPVGYGLYEVEAPQKYSPSMKMYVSKSTSSSITYRYYTSDPDNAIYKGTDSNSNVNYIYYKVEDDIEKYVNLNSDPTKNEFTINNLNSGDIYSIYYKLSVLNTGDIDDDITVLSDPKFKDFKFDGKINSSDYTFTYGVVNQPDKNRVAIVIESGSLLLESTLQYDVTFNAVNSKNNEQINPYVVRTSKLSECSGVPDAPEGDRCIFVDYVTLKNNNMKSNSSNGNNINITVEIKAAYDTGITGYNVGNIGYGNDKDYFIFKQTSRKNVDSKYLVLDSNGNIIDNWVKSNVNSSGYYQYKKNLRDNELNPIASIDLKRVDISTNPSQSGIQLLLNNYGYVRATQSTGESINPRIVSLENMTPSSNNVFMFSSITPKASPDTNSYVPFLSGTGLKLNVSGIDLTDFSVPNLYIEVWDNEDDVGNLNKTSHPTYEITGLEDGITSINNIIIDGLHSYIDGVYPRYYYRVYAKLYSIKNGSNDTACIEQVDNSTCIKYIQLDHLSSGTATQEPMKMEYYTFSTSGGSDLLNSFGIKLNEESLNIEYGERKITANIGLNTYGRDYADYRDYDLRYYLIATSMSCSSVPEDLSSENIVLKSDLVVVPESGNVKDIVDVFNNDKLVYGSNYKMCVFADYDFYVRQDNQSEPFEVIREMVQLTPQTGTFKVKLDSLKEPSFKVIREARLTNDGHPVVDINVIVDDPDKVLLPASSNSNPNDFNGVYKINMSMENDENNSVVGTLEAFTELGYEAINGDYSLLSFDASEINARYRISDLDLSTSYKLKICGDVYINNDGYISNSPYDDPIDKENNYKYHRVCTRNYSISTVDSNGISLGNVLYSINSTKVMATFMGGSNLFANSWNVDTQSWNGAENSNYINYLMYTLQNEKTGILYSGEFALGVPGDDEHYFVYDSDSDEWQLTLRDRMNNETGDIYTIKIMLWDKNTENPEYDEENAIYVNTGTQVYIADRGN